MGLSKKIEHQMLRDILGSGEDGVYVYTIPSQYKIKVEEVFPFIGSYSKWLEYVNGKVRVFPYAKKALENALGYVISNSQTISEDGLGYEFRGERLSTEDFKEPSIKFFVQLLRQNNSHFN